MSSEVKSRLKRIAREASELVAWLNGRSEPKEEREKIAAIVRDMNGVLESAMARRQPLLTEDFWKAVELAGMDDVWLSEAVSRFGHLSQLQERSEVGDIPALIRLNDTLREFTYRPFVHLNLSSRKEKRALKVEFIPLRSLPLDTKSIKVGHMRRLHEQEKPSWMIFKTTLLAREGELHRIRECHCGRWFFAQRLDRRHHSPACRSKAPKDEEQRQARRDYMRDYMRRNAQKGKLKRTSKGRK
jgi:hypothetical protein